METKKNDKKIEKKLMKSTKIVRTQSSTMDQSRPRLHQFVKTNQKQSNEINQNETK